MSPECILVVDDKQAVLTALQQLLETESHEVLTITDPSLIPGILSVRKIDLVLMDMNFRPGESSGREGLEWLRRILDLDPQMVVVTMTAYGETALAVEAMKTGAVDFIVKPWDNEKLLATVNSGLKLKNSYDLVARLRMRQEYLQSQLAGPETDMIGESTAIKEVKKIIARVAPTDSSILVLGENGTGKEMIAREIHKQSLRSQEAFVHVDLGAISDTLFESELFGHVRGAFTDAATDRAGRFEVSSGGTLFLDEIGNLPYHLQGKLLNVLQNREVYRVGSNRAISVDVRIICATNRDLRQMIANRKFREDLYYRINTIEILAPPLRDRGRDIILLAKSFIDEYMKKLGKPGLQFSQAYFEELMDAPWPGNIRQLRNHIERSVILFDGSDSPDLFRAGQAIRDEEGRPEKGSLQGMERELLIRVIRKHAGNIKRAALELGVARSTVYNKMKRYRIKPDHYDQ